MKTVRISERTARALLAELPQKGTTVFFGHPLASAWDELERALSRLTSPKRIASRRATRARKTEKAKTKKEKRAEVRAAVMARAEGLCEACRADCGTPAGLELDHFLGRARAESVETCWALCSDCHRLKTDNEPSAAWWLRRFIRHCDKHGYFAEGNRTQARLAFVEARKGQASHA